MNLSWLEAAEPLRSHLEAALSLRASRDCSEFWNDSVWRETCSIRKSEPESGSIYREKASGEFEPLLALFPNILAMPWQSPVSVRFLVAIRPLPIHLLGLPKQREWADGDWRSPAEFFYHDLDHARFKIREDLLALGYACPDAYQSVDGEPPSTFDPATGQHRSILSDVRRQVAEAAPELWRLVPERLHLARRMLEKLEDLEQRHQPLAEAAELLLFEIVHEKSMPLDAAILRRELSHQQHPRKLTRKFDSGFFGPHQPSGASKAPWEDARSWLLNLL